jgi:hypothetical protein
MTFRFSKALVIGVTGALGVIVWSGCGSDHDERYYCDSAGCYECDGYGCAAVRGPAHPTCTGAASCKAGEVCTATGCTASCSSNAQCPKGETCQSGLCSPPGVLPGAQKECTTKVDCGGGKTCNAGKCEACGGTAGPCSCTTASDCEGGFACIAGACTAPQNTCKYSSECGGDGKVCAEGQCLTSCESGPCSTGFTCEKGVCQPSPTGGGGGGGCTSAAQCTSPDAPTCVSGSCVKSCSGDPECGDGKYCNQGACVVDTRPKPNCTRDDECGGTVATPKKCVGGYCKYACTTSEYCRTIDNRIGVCAKDMVCRSATEADATCFGPGECPSGKSCVSNQCL